MKSKVEKMLERNAQEKLEKLENEVNELKEILLSSARDLTPDISEDSLDIMREAILDKMDVIDSLKEKIRILSNPLVFSEEEMKEYKESLKRFKTNPLWAVKGEEDESSVETGKK